MSRHILKCRSSGAVWAVCLVISAAAGGQESPYTEFEGREIKALGAGQVEQYLAGAGMAMALAGELNGYPGPRHVLELAGELGISQTQRSEAQAIFDRMDSEARRLGHEIVEKERRLDRLFATGVVDDAAVMRLSEDIGRLNGVLRGVHLRAHVEMARVLDERQRQHYRSLRGYGGHSGHQRHQDHLGEAR